MKLLLVDCASSFHFRDIERVLREMVVGSYTGRKPNYNDFLKSKFEGARYVDDDGVLMDGVQAGRAGSRVARVSKDDTPLTTKGLMWRASRSRLKPEVTLDQDWKRLRWSIVIPPRTQTYCWRSSLQTHPFSSLVHLVQVSLESVTGATAGAIA